MITQTKSKELIFPEQALRDVLRKELITAATIEAATHGATLPMLPAKAVVAPVTIDSLVVVELLCAVEPVLGFPPSDNTVRAGGYNSVQDALDHLMPGLEDQWRKQKGVKT